MADAEHGRAWHWAPLAGLVAVGIAAWWTFARHIDLVYAWQGWSVLTWLDHLRMPENFTRDFSQGTSVYGKSAFLHVYPLAQRWLGIPPETMLHVVPAFELAAVALASLALAWALAKRQSAWVAATVFMYIVASWGADLDLARFGMPYSYTLYYYTAESCRLAAVALALRRHYAAGGLLLACGAATHPSMSLYAGLFIIAAMAVTPRDFLSRAAITGAALFCAIAGSWIVTQILLDPSISVTGEKAPPGLWLDIMRAFNYHFFPVEFGVFAQADVRFLPLLSLFVLWLHYLTRIDLSAEDVRRLTYGMVAMAVVATAGVLLSVLAPSPLLAKLSPHRASLLAVLLALPVVAAGLWRDLVGESAIRRITAAGTLVAPFLMDPGWPLVFTVVLAFPGWWTVATRRNRSPADRIGAVLLAVTLVLCVYYVAVGLVSARTHVFRANTAIWYAVAAFILGAWVIARFVRTPSARRAAGLVMMLAGCGIWLSARQLPTETLQLYADYKAAQLWAREHTTHTSLFMVDPSLHYGWRDFSQRSSFGNLHEWLHTSWVYTSELAAYREGYRRFSEFGIDLAPYLDQRPSVVRGFEALTPVIGERYNTADDAWRRRMAQKYGIDYFVVRKARWKAHTALPIAFENGSILIVGADERVKHAR